MVIAQGKGEKMWKILDAKVNIYPAPDLKLLPIQELTKGDSLDVIPGLFTSEIKKDGKVWLKVKLSDGRKGYVLSNVNVENIGNGTRICPECGCTNSVEEMRCVDCQHNFRPARFAIPSTYLENTVKVSVPNICYSCCSTKDLQKTEINEKRIITNTSSATFSLQAFICPECAQIHAAEEKYKKKIDRFIGRWGFLIVALAVFAFFFLIGLFMLVSSIFRGYSLLFPTLLSVISLGVSAGIFFLARKVKENMQNLKESPEREHVQLIKRFGHAYQSISFDPPAGKTPWILKIYNREYADQFAKLNPDFKRVRD